MARTAVVTDSAAELPPEVAAEAGITVVPLIVSFGADEAFADEVARAIGLPRPAVSITLMGPSIAPHVGPGAVGTAVPLPR